MASKIPPHNLGEVIDGMCHLIDNPEAELDELCQHIKGPDFPTGGIVMGMSGIRAAYATGRGKLVVRAKTEIEEMSNGKFRIIITEIPYMVNKKDLVKAIVNLSDEKRVEGIDDVVDHSSKRDGGMRIVVDLKRDANPQVVLNKLFSYTELQTTFGVINLALVNGKPKILTLKEMLQHYIDFQCEVIERRTRFDLKKAKERAHILEGLMIALDFIDEVIAILRKSKSIADGKEALIARFNLSDAQATAIVQMRLGQLTGLERAKIEEELAALNAKIKELETILGDHMLVLDIVKTEALNIRDRYADDRRTEITAVSGDVDIEDLIPENESVITLSQMGYIKRVVSDEFALQNRGGRGKKGATNRDEDVTKQMFVCSSHDRLLFFTNMGRMYKLKAYEVPEGSRTSKGLNIVNVLPLLPDEKVSVMVKANDLSEEGKFLCMVTKNGVIKRTELNKYDSNRKGGINAIVLDDDDELKWVQLTDGGCDLLVATKNGWAIRFKETDCRPIGRTARGVKAITLREGDEVVGMAVVDESKTLLTVTETGFGRRSSFDNYRVQSRGGKGITNYRTALYGKVAAVHAVDENDDALLITSGGIVIRVYTESVSLFARGSKGVRVMKPDEGTYVVTMELAEHSEDEETVEVIDDGSGAEGADTADAAETPEE